MSVDDTTAPPAVTKQQLIEMAELLAIVKGRVMDAYKDVTTELRAHVGEGETIRPVFGAHKLGAVLVNQRLPKVEVTDPAALRDWVEQYYPDFITVQVAAAFLKLLTITGNAQTIVGPDGEIDIPGVAVGYEAPADKATVRRPAAADEDAILFDLLEKYRDNMAELLPGADQ